MKAILRNSRISPKKANLVAGLVRGATVEDALDQLKFTPKKAAQILYKVISSAAANAVTNFKQKKERLYIKEIIVTKGPTLKRSVSISKGRMHPIKKRTCNITVHVDVQAGTAKPRREAKGEVSSERSEAHSAGTADKATPKKVSKPKTK